MQEHYSWVLEQLLPIVNIDASRAELARFRLRGNVWRPLYDTLHRWAEELQPKAPAEAETKKKGLFAQPEWLKKAPGMAHVNKAAAAVGNTVGQGAAAVRRHGRARRGAPSRASWATPSAPSARRSRRWPAAPLPNVETMSELLSQEKSWNMAALAPGEYMRRAITRRARAR